MTGRTHDLAAFTAMTAVLVSNPIPQMTLATALVAFGANMMGGLAPDLDQPTASFYKKFRGGKVISKLIKPLIGGHRYISHSIVGVIIVGYFVNVLLTISQDFLIVDRSIVWWAFMIGYASHLLMDSLTDEGVPWLFPIPFKFGFPPFAFLRMKTGGLVEKSFVFPGLIALNFYLFYTNYQVFLNFLKNYIK